MTINKQTIKNNLFLYRKIYIIAYLIFLFLRAIVPISSVIPGKIDTVFTFILITAGAIYILLDLLTYKTFLKMRFFVFLAAFTLITIISSIVNSAYGLFDNFKTISWMVVQFCILFSVFQDRDSAEIKKENKIIVNILCVVWFFAIISSILMFLLQIGYEVIPVGAKLPVRQGFFEMRLWGVFKDPNYAAIISIVCIIFCLRNFKNTKSIFQKIFFATNILLQYIYIVLSGSRTAMVTFIIVTCIGLFLIIKKHLQVKKLKRILRNVVSISIAAIISITLFASFSLSKTVLQETPKVVESIFGKTHHIGTISLERVDVVDNDDISNLRFKIWTSGLDLFKTRPILGTSPRNQLKIALNEQPKGFIAQKKYMVHNGFLDVLISTGVVGLMVILLFMAILAYTVFKYLFCTKIKQDNYTSVVVCLSVLIIITISSFFVCEIFFTNTIGTLLFWYSLGNMIYFMKKDFDKSEVKMAPQFCESINNKIVKLFTKSKMTKKSVSISK